MEVTAGLAESNGSLLPGLWRDSLHVTCGLTACTPGSAPGPTLGNEYGKTLPLPYPTTLFSTGRMPFLPPKQQRQSTEGTCYDTDSCTSRHTPAVVTYWPAAVNDGMLWYGKCQFI